MASTIFTDWKFLSPAIIVVASQVFILLERMFPADRQRLFRKGWAIDFFLYTLLQSYLLGLLINAFIAFLDGRTGLSRLHLVSGWPLWAQLGFFFVTHDFYI